jgi:hypothetical protein
MIKAMQSAGPRTPRSWCLEEPGPRPVRAMGVFNTPRDHTCMQLPNGQYIDLMAEMGMYVPQEGMIDG